MYGDGSARRVGGRVVMIQGSCLQFVTAQALSSASDAEVIYDRSN